MGYSWLYSGVLGSHFVSLLCFIVSWILLRRNAKTKLAAAVALAVVIITLFDLLVELVSINLRSPFSSLVETIALMFFTFGSAVIIFAVFRYYYRPALDGPLGFPDPAALRTAVSNILDSESFLSALRSTLPKGKDDQQYGLDYVPFMLHSIDERRKRATRSARLFLLATVVAALTFSSVVMYFGYILVNEAAAGTAKSLADLRDTTQRVSDTLRSIIPGYFNNPKFQQDVAPALEKLAAVGDPGPKNKENYAQVRIALDEAKNTGDFTTLKAALAKAQAAVSTETVLERNYSAVLADGADRLTKFIDNQSSALPELASRTSDLRLLTSRVQDVLDKPENRTPEIIKRLALGIVISTFFLALLRYLGTLYKTRHLQVLEAEKDDFAVRRFYVAFKSSLASDEQRKAVLTSFMASPNNGEAKETSDDTTKQEFEVIKELVMALSKRL